MNDKRGFSVSRGPVFILDLLILFLFLDNFFDQWSFL